MRAVTITNVDTNLTRGVVTGSDGTYVAPELPSGNYEVQAMHVGFKTAARKGITLEVADQAVINLTLEIGSTEQTVVVTGEAPIVNTQDATLGGIVNQKSIEDLPLNGRNYVDLSLLQPGVTQDKNSSGNGATSFSVNGAGPRSNNFTLDGAVTQTQEGRNPGNAGSTLGVDGIKEYKIITSTFAAEYGLAMGSQVVVVSKNGTNQFHGDAFEYIRNSALDAKNFFLTSQPIPEFQKNQFGGALGGPIKKDRTFFFGVYEGLRQNLGVAQNLTVPVAGCHGAAGATILLANCPDIAPFTSVVVNANVAPILALYPLPNVPAAGTGLAHLQFGNHNGTSENYGQMRVDQTLSTADTLFARYTVDNAIINTTVGNSSNLTLLGNLSQANNRNTYITLSENHIFSPTILNTARLSFSRTRVATAGVDPVTGPAITPGNPMGNIGIGGGTSTNGTYATLTAGAVIPALQLQNIYTLSDDVSWTRGKHTFKFGTLLNRWNEVVNSPGNIDGQIIYPTFADFLLDQPNLIEFKTLTSVSYRFTVFNTLGFYGQDDWRVSRRLTLNLGLRYEFMTTPRELNGIQSRVVNDFTDPFTIGPIIKNNTKHDLSPRIGVAYDLFGNGKTALRSGFGIYYDLGNIGGALQQDVIGTPPFSGLTDITAQSSPPVQSYYPVAFPLSSTILNTTGSVTPQFIDYDFKSPYMIQYNISLQQQLPWNMGLSVGYVGNHGVHLATIRESNPILPTSTGPCGDPASRCVDGVVQFWDTGSPKYHPINPNMPSTINIATASDSRYNALQIVLIKRLSHGLQFQSSFTHSRVTDDTQGQENVRDCSAAAGIQGVDPLHPREVDSGPACFDLPNNWQFSMVYHLPTVSSGNGLLKTMANGWWMGSIASIQSGLPFSVITTANRSNSGVLQGQSDRVNINTPALLAAYPCTSLPGQPKSGNNPCAYTPIPYDPKTVINGTDNLGQYFNPAMFSLSPNFASPSGGGNTIGQLGNSDRNILYGPHARTLDVSLVKDTRIGFLGEGGLLQFRAEFFNVLNHPNFAGPNAIAFTGTAKDLTPFSETPRGTAGSITRQIQTPRDIQFALRLQF